MVRFDDIRSLVGSWANDWHMALTFCKGRTCAGNLRYAELHRSRAGGRRLLWESHGVRPGDRIAVLSPNRLDVPVLMLAAMSIAAAVVPLNPDHAAGRLEIHHRSLEGSRVLRGGRPRVEARRRTLASTSCPHGVRAKVPLAALAQLPGGHPLHVGYDRPAQGRRAGAAEPARERVEYGDELRAVQDDAARRAAALSRARARIRPDDSPDDAAATSCSPIGSIPSRGPSSSARTKSSTRAWCRPLLPLLLQVKINAARVPSLRAILVSSAPLTADLARDFRAPHRHSAGPGLGPVRVHATSRAACRPMTI